MSVGIIFLMISKKNLSDDALLEPEKQKQILKILSMSISFRLLYSWIQFLPSNEYFSKRTNYNGVWKYLCLGNTLLQLIPEGYHLISSNTSNTFVYVMLICNFRYWFCVIIWPSRWNLVCPGLKTRVFQGPSLLCWCRTQPTTSLVSLQILECLNYLVG